MLTKTQIIILIIVSILGSIIVTSNVTKHLLQKAHADTITITSPTGTIKTCTTTTSSTGTIIFCP